MTIGKWLELAKKRIPALDAELILLFGLREALPPGVDRSYLQTHLDVGMGQRLWLELDERLERRAVGEPLAYIVGEKEFYGRDFKVNPQVLIPRPETEQIVELALEWSEKYETLLREQKRLKVLEIGTGSGCIAVTLALELRRKVPEEVAVRVVATDLSPAALEVARENARNFGAEVEFLESDLLEKVGNAADFDLLVANLPYVDPEWTWLERKSLDFEPQEALYAADKGLALYESLFVQTRQFGAPRGLICEADPCQHADLVQIAARNGYKKCETRGFALWFERREG